MPPDPLKLLLTGEPGCGKTTAVLAVIERLRGVVPMTGFVTQEIRTRGHRVGFRGVLVPDGASFVLAHVDRKGPAQVGPYGVEVAELDAVGVPALRPAEGVRLVVLDEIGKMECFSTAFRGAVDALLDGQVPLLATVALHGVGFPKRVRQDPRVEIITMSSASRASIGDEILRRLVGVGVAPAALTRKAER